MKTLTLTALAFFVGYQIGKRKPEKEEHPLEKRAIPIIREIKIHFV